MRKEIVLVLVAAVLLLGGAAAVFGSVSMISFCKVPVFDPGDRGGGIPATPNGEPIPDGPS